MTVSDDTHVVAKRIEVAPEGTLIIGPDARNVRLELIQDDCRGPSAPFPDDTSAVHASACLRFGQLVSRGLTRIDAAPVTSWTVMKKDANAGARSIQVNECDGWTVGANIAIANGAGQNNAQEHVISDIEGSNCIVGLASPLSQVVRSFTGFTTGSLVPLEVLYLKRNVVITGTMIGRDSEPKFRQGIVVSQRNTGVLQLSNALVENCGRIFQGEYCVHLHLLGSSPSSLIEGNAIINGISKGITVHGTHHSSVADNVVYNIKGVGIYVENGKGEIG